MNLIILSDTHIKHGQSLLSHLPQELISMIKSSDLIIHAGDFETLFSYQELETLGKLAAVHGDTDSPELMSFLPERKVIKIEEIKVGIIHKGQLTSENTDGLRYLAKEMGVDVLIFGHFHHTIVHKSTGDRRSKRYLA
jgi:putative phosphoesterase